MPPRDCNLSLSMFMRPKVSSPPVTVIWT
ncbi:hypothetical protein NC652_037528 [Populus alba x Populus x berolinensis]|nr:hypothetical protein NC652_037526 [Populus alba x Populus x berolinensis]KAJ6866026.1 hypothetical protein NC652_037527 [Populus alba x Populus x berolinensis]KAJ6866027.1 hypothetical protein NC652_037528 [Populus alba x Populus x berolinensis]